MVHGPNFSNQGMLKNYIGGSLKSKNLTNKYRGLLVGLATGDTLGMSLEFKDPSEFEPISKPEAGGPFNLPLGYWTDDTSMALCLADSLIEKKGYDSYDVMDKYWLWRSEGYRSSTGKCFDIGNQVSSAINEYMREGNAVVPADSRRLSSAGNGSVMRLAPIIVASHASGNSLEETMHISQISARETHYSIEAEAGTALFGALLFNAIEASSKEEIFEYGNYDQTTVFTKIRDVISRAETRSIKEIKPTGYIIDSLTAAVWGFLNNDSFESGALAVVNLGGDADTIGAIYGQLAGAFYGYDSIPDSWKKILYMEAEMCDISDRLSDLPTCHILVTRFEEDGNDYCRQPSMKSELGDITKLEVDAIVNAANTKLFGGSGVCGAIFNAAGYEDMSAACQKIGHCEYGDAVITPGFELPATYVIHTVGPIYGQHEGSEPDILQSCYWESLRLAQAHRLRTIAFPLISTGIYGYPKEEAIKVAISSIKDFYEDNPHTSIEQVILVGFDQEDYELIKSALKVTIS